VTDLEKNRKELEEALDAIKTHIRENLLMPIVENKKAAIIIIALTLFFIVVNCLAILELLLWVVYK
jgi:hypothetical protein